MKRHLIRSMLSVGIILFLYSVPAHSAIVSFNILDSSIEANESFGVEVSVLEDVSAGDLTAFGFDVDPLSELTLFTFDSYTIGPDYLDLGAGNYVAGLKDSITPNAGTNVFLATLLMTAGPVTGTDTLSILGIFDAFDRGLYYVDADRSIDSSVDITIVPLPAAVWLLGCGLVGLIVINRSRFQNNIYGFTKTEGPEGLAQK